VRKSDAALDLAIALGVLEAIGKIPSGCLQNTLVLGELSLDGQVQPIRGVLPQLAQLSAVSEVQSYPTPIAVKRALSRA
jgi:magnesium chelatase family protein